MSDETAINEITVSFSPHDRYEIAHYHALITEAARLASVEHYKHCKTRKIENRNIEPTIMHTEIRGRMPCGCARLGTGVATANGREYCMRHGVYA